MPLKLVYVDRMHIDHAKRTHATPGPHPRTHAHVNMHIQCHTYLHTRPRTHACKCTHACKRTHARTHADKHAHTQPHYYAYTCKVANQHALIYNTYAPPTPIRRVCAQSSIKFLKAWATLREYQDVFDFIFVVPYGVEVSSNTFINTGPPSGTTNNVLQGCIYSPGYGYTSSPGAIPSLHEMGKQIHGPNSILMCGREHEMAGSTSVPSRS